MGVRTLMIIGQVFYGMSCGVRQGSRVRSFAGLRGGLPTLLVASEAGMKAVWIDGCCDGRAV